MSSLREDAARRAAAANGPSYHHQQHQPMMHASYPPAPQQQQPMQYQHHASSMMANYPQQQQLLSPPPAGSAPQLVHHHHHHQQQYPQQQQQQPHLQGSSSMYAAGAGMQSYPPYQQQQQQQPHHMGGSAVPHRTPLQPQQQQPNVQDVRQAWRKYGSRLTQQLEDVRVDPTNGRPTDLAVKVVSAIQKTDPAQQPYTAYTIHLWHPHSPEKPQQTVERRYSDFWKFKESLKDVQELAIPVPFPAKQAWFRKADERVIQDRVTQLDAWLVYIVRAYNNGRIQDTTGFLAPQPLALPFQQNVTTTQHNLHNPFSFSLASALRQSAFTITSWANSSTASIPPRNVTAVACLTLAKAGCLVTGRVGTGVVFRRLGPTMWSAPVAVQSVGVGWGAGGSVTHCVLLWDTPVAANTTLLVSTHTVHAVTTAGWTVPGLPEGAVLHVRDAVNAKFYGRTVATSQLLQTDGETHVPAARPIYQHLRLLLGQ